MFWIATSTRFNSNNKTINKRCAVVAADFDVDAFVDAAVAFVPVHAAPSLLHV